MPSPVKTETHPSLYYQTTTAEHSLINSQLETLSSYSFVTCETFITAKWNSAGLEAPADMPHLFGMSLS